MKKFLILIVGFGFVFGNILKTDENLISGKLENGFTYYIYKNSTPKNAAELYLYVNAGSTNEKENEQGLAHFVEHMVFNGSEDFSKNELVSTLEGLGVKFGPDLNAATGFDKTYYKIHVKTDEKSLTKAFKVFDNMAGKVLFNDEDLQAEKGVIIEEDRIYNNSEKRIFDQENPYLFGDSIYSKRLPIGKMDIIRSATPEIMKEFYYRNYQPKNMSFIAVGDFDVENIQNLIKKHFGYLKDGGSNLNIDKTIPFFNKFIYFNAHDEEINDNSIRVYYEDTYKGGINSYDRLKEQLIIKYISALFSLMSDKRFETGESLLKTDFYPINLQKQKVLNSFIQNVVAGDFNTSLNDVFSVINGVKKFGFNESDFNVTKNDFIKENEAFYAGRQTIKSSVYVHELFNYVDSNSTFISDKNKYELTKKALEEITIDDINTKFKKITDVKGVIVELLSQQKQNFTQEQIENFMKAAPYNTSYQKKLPDSLFDDSNLTVQKPIKEKFDKNNAIYEFEFSNGARVIYKELSTKKDTVLFTAVKIGGISNFEDAKNAKFAVEVSNGSGIGEFNDYEVTKITAGENFSINKFINQVSLGFNGNSTTNDTKNLLKAFYAEFSYPKISDNYAKRFATLSLDNIEKNEQNPDYKFMREFMDFYYDKNPKMSITSKDDIENISIQKMRNFLEDNFKNAGEYAFVFVGDISKDAIKELAGKYIANLKGTRSNTDIKDDGVRSLSKEAVFIKDYLSEDRAKVKMFIKNENVKFDIRKSFVLNAATEALNVLMREKIREEDGSVYGIYGASTLAKFPYEMSSLQISFSSSPKNVAQIVSNVKSIIAYMQSKQIDKRYLENYKKSKKIALAKQYEEPNFWLEKIKNSYILKERILNYENEAEIIDSISLKDIQNAAKVYFDTKNFIVSVLVYKGIKDELGIK